MRQLCQHPLTTISMESEALRKKLRLLAKKKAQKCADGGTIDANTATSLKPLLKEVYNSKSKTQALKSIRDRKTYKPRKPKLSIPKG